MSSLCLLRSGTVDGRHQEKNQYRQTMVFGQTGRGGVEERAQSSLKDKKTRYDGNVTPYSAYQQNIKLRCSTLIIGCHDHYIYVVHRKAN
ncbi:hypothetical protein QTP88_019104 [Uroleucon formosanum]